MLLRFLPVLLLALLPALVAQAQQPPAVVATGRVVAKATGAPLSQTTVRLDGQPGGVSTDEAGRFRLPLAGAPADARLVVSRLGYQSQTLPVAQLGTEVQLEEMSYQIGEVLVTYERIRKLLLRKWRIDEASLDVIGQRIIASTQKRDSAKAARMARDPEALRKVLRLARYIFHDDGSVKARVLLFGSTGTWQLDEQSRKLRITNAKGQEALRDVVELTEQRLVLQPEAAGQPAVVYVPAD